MMNSTMITFFSVSLLMALMPGPDNIFLVTQSTLQGKKAGLILAAGLCAGLIFHTAAVALGVAAALKTYPMAFTLIKISGASYLLYLGWLSFKPSGPEKAPGDVPLLRVHKLFLRGILMNITNPKVSIFFLAFLPQFVVPAEGPVGWQLVTLGLVFMSAAGIVFSLLSVISGTVGSKFLTSANAIARMNKVGGVIFILLAVKLII